MDTDVEKKRVIKDTHKDGLIKLLSQDTKKYMNLDIEFIYTRGGRTSENITFQPEDWQWLRDQLLEIYPLEEDKKEVKVVDFDYKISYINGMYEVRHGDELIATFKYRDEMFEFLDK